MARRSIRTNRSSSVARAFERAARLCVGYVPTWSPISADPQSENCVEQTPRPPLWTLGQVLVLSFLLLSLQSAAMAVLGSGSVFDVTVRVKLPQAMYGLLPGSYGDVVVWLVPMPTVRARSPDATHPPYCIAQHNKRFEPRLLVVPVGSTVEFCNRDPWVHEPFAFSDGHLSHSSRRRGGRKMLQIDRAGVTYLFCAVHPQMGAVILAVDSPYFGVANKWGRVRISGVPAGTYSVHFWYEQPAIKVSPRLAVLPGQNCRLRGCIGRKLEFRRRSKGGGLSPLSLATTRPSNIRAAQTPAETTTGTESPQAHTDLH